MIRSNSTILVTRLDQVLTRLWLDSTKFQMTLTRLWLDGLMTLTRQKWLEHITGRRCHSCSFCDSLCSNNSYYTCNHPKLFGLGLHSPDL